MVFFIYKWVWITYCLSDCNEVVIPAYDSIGAYSFQVGPSVRQFAHFLIAWLVGWLVHSFVRSASDCECILWDNFCMSYGTLFACNFNIVILCERSDRMVFGHSKFLYLINFIIPFRKHKKGWFAKYLSLWPISGPLQIFSYSILEGSLEGYIYSKYRIFIRDIYFFYLSLMYFYSFS
jgi:hypothetical protein